MPLLQQIVIFLGAAVLAVPLFRRLGLGAVLGYLMAGVVIGPWGLDSAGNVQAIMHFGEIGVVFLLFVIGLELQPARLRAMRRAVFGPGIAQVLLSGAALAALALAFGLDPKAALVVGFALALSSTAFVLHLLADRHELKTQHGRRGFGILLFQDLAAVPMIAALPLLAAHSATAQPLTLLLNAGWIALALGIFIIGGRYLLRPVLRLVAAAQSHEIFTAAALLLVMGSASIMHAIDMSMGLGAFLAGALVADSEYRHQLQADIDPFRGLLLGLFFIAVGMSVNVGLIVTQPLLIIALAAGLITVKALILYAITRGQGVSGRQARRLALYLAQGGELAFVLLGQALDLGILPATTVELITVVVALSMALTPLLTALQNRLDRRQSAPARPFDAIEETEPTVVIAGFGRFGQVIGRLLASQGISFTALEISPAQVDFVRRFGNKIYYGDASRLDLLRAAQVDQARLFVLAVDDPEASMKIARTLRHLFPNVPLYARARNRQHAHQLMDLGAKAIIRETFLSSLHLGGQVLEGLGWSASQAAHAMTLFRDHDERTLARQRPIREDREALIQSSKEAARELKALFEADAESRQGEPVFNRKRNRQVEYANAADDDKAVP
ncbi:MAG: cation:proton antiporter [Nitrococcus mobilis]|nr:cation:proton antiporter [Nitrococcus mobilis]